ncbi:hypothetical protein J1614_012067 [Plenodomus biglobosus]|nr:hypothetical protein J1614_012067 [Plenodomus biglobosus]
MACVVGLWPFDDAGQPRMRLPAAVVWRSAKLIAALPFLHLDSQCRATENRNDQPLTNLTAGGAKAPAASEVWPECPSQGP